MKVTGLWVLLGSLVAAFAIGLVHRVRDGRFRVVPRRVQLRTDHGAGTWPGQVEVQDEAPAMRREADAGTDAANDRGATSLIPASGIAGELAELGVGRGARATLLQFSTAFCAPCRATRQVLADVARIVPGVAHVEVDAESHLELVRRLGVRRTPTVLVLDRDAAEVRRASGAPPGRAAVFAALAPVLGQVVDGPADGLVDVPHGAPGARQGGLDGGR